MHIFLTGQPHVGKSTLISRALEAFPGLTVRGFRTFSADDISRGVSEVFITDALDERMTPIHRVGVRTGPFTGKESFPQVFDDVGAEFLRRDGAEMIIMDELGNMERNAPKFQKAVFDALDSGAVALGVIKPKSSPFLDAVRSRKDVYVIEVTKENRDELLPVLVEKLVLALGR
ncbi:MAG: hypothetical protein IJP23_01030 [Oscillospiraceae bacterium]|nr:hypothetical protein [Oscillospiraceae bacterium]